VSQRLDPEIARAIGKGKRVIYIAEGEGSYAHN
jgi:hypothetical protein